MRELTELEKEIASEAFRAGWKSHLNRGYTNTNLQGALSRFVHNLEINEA